MHGNYINFKLVNTMYSQFFFTSLEQRLLWKLIMMDNIHSSNLSFISLVNNPLKENIHFTLFTKQTLTYFQGVINLVIRALHVRRFYCFIFKTNIAKIHFLVKLFGREHVNHK